MHFSKKKKNRIKNSCILTCILQKEKNSNFMHLNMYFHSNEKKKTKSKIHIQSKEFHAFKCAFSLRKFIKFHAFINVFFKKKKNSNFMHSNMHFHLN